MFDGFDWRRSTDEHQQPIQPNGDKTNKNSKKKKMKNKVVKKVAANSKKNLDCDRKYSLADVALMNCITVIDDGAVHSADKLISLGGHKVIKSVTVNDEAAIGDIIPRDCSVRLKRIGEIDTKDVQFEDDLYVKDETNLEIDISSDDDGMSQQTSLRQDNQTLHMADHTYQLWARKEDEQTDSRVMSKQQHQANQSSSQVVEDIIYVKTKHQLIYSSETLSNDNLSYAKLQNERKRQAEEEEYMVAVAKPPDCRQINDGKIMIII